MSATEGTKKKGQDEITCTVTLNIHNNLRQQLNLVFKSFSVDLILKLHT